MDPPSYNALGLASHQDLPNYAELIASDSIRAPEQLSTPPEIVSSHASRSTTHVYSVPSKKGVPWLTLRVASKARSPDHLPHFAQGQPIVGLVHLDLGRETTIKAVNISFTGDLITPEAEFSPFLHISEDLWSLAKGDPRGTHSDDTENQPPLPWKEKLHGQFSWPFSLQLPNHIQMKLGQVIQTYKLPASFLERGANVTILYRLKVTVTRNKFQSTSSVDTTVNYVPRIRPDPPSLARQLAYQERHPLIEPNGDPDGWHTLTSVMVLGTLFNTRTIGVQCILSLASPLSYTRGTTIPLFVTLRSSDTQALDVLVTQKAVVVRLKRTILAVNGRPVPPGETAPDPESTTTCQTAVWWPSPFEAVDNASSQVRDLQGEICLPQSLAPTALLDRCRITYTVDLFPFQAVGFAPAQLPSVPLQSISVEIATAFAHGPRPISYSGSLVSA